MRQNVKWIIVFALILVMSTTVWVLHKSFSGGAKTARIIQDGVVIRTVNLQTNIPYEFTVASSDGGENTIRVENGKIGIIKASCPDKICVNQGFIRDGSVPIVCLPNKLSIIVDADSAEADAVIGGQTR